MGCGSAYVHSAIIRRSRIRRNTNVTKRPPQGTMHTRSKIFSTFFLVFNKIKQNVNNTKATQCDSNSLSITYSPIFIRFSIAKYLTHKWRKVMKKKRQQQNHLMTKHGLQVVYNSFLTIIIFGIYTEAS